MATGVPNAILAINSLDRFIEILAGQGNQPVQNTLQDVYYVNPPYSNDFTISSPGALIYGYINRIVVSQIQIQYFIPTVINFRNDRFFIGLGPPNAGIKYAVDIPFGFYSPDELAIMLIQRINLNPTLAALGFTCDYNPKDGFIFDVSPLSDFYFPTYDAIVNTPGESVESANVVLKTYKLLGMTILNSDTDNQQASSMFPNFLYTPYIDFYSDILTNYQNMKDTNTSIAKPKGLIARVYLSGNGNVQSQTETSALGTTPFVVTADMNSPKIIKWTPDVAVPSIDFQLRDCYGDLIPTTPDTGSFSTEFQMTLLCVEDDR
jgi:hypothetical protein